MASVFYNIFSNRGTDSVPFPNPQAHAAGSRHQKYLSSGALDKRQELNARSFTAILSTWVRFDLHGFLLTILSKHKCEIVGSASCPATKKRIEIFYPLAMELINRMDMGLAK